MGGETAAGRALGPGGEGRRPAVGCPDDEEICGFVEGGVSPRRWLGIFIHVYLRRCRYCREQVKEFVATLRVIKSEEPVTLVDLFERAHTYNKPEALNYKRDGAKRSISSDELITRARNIALGLHQLGVRRGQLIVLFAANSPEWTLTDAGTHFLGAVDVPIHPTEESAKVGSILRKISPHVIFIQDRDSFERIRREVDREIAFGSLKHIIFFSEHGAEEVAALTLTRVEELGRALGQKHPYLAEELAREVLPHDAATIIHTSGTTGEPKGVVLSHANLVNNIVACADALAPTKKDVALSLLPLSHALERIAMYVYLYCGLSVYYAEPINLDSPSAGRALCETLREVKPTVMVGVPRIYEKIYAWLKARPPKEWRAALGGRIRLFISGEEALWERVEREFNDARIPIVQGYGLTETSPVIAVGTPKRSRTGTVGRPIKRVEVRIDDSGEILTRGPCVALGYFKDPETTRNSFTPDGWFRTGDYGKLHKGYLTVKGRIIEAVITSEGATIDPQRIEHRIKESPFVTDAAVKQVRSKDGRTFLAAVIVPDFGQLRAFAQIKEIKANSPRELCDHPLIREHIRSAALALVKELKPSEGIPSITLSTREFTHEEGDLTVSSKVKRKAVFDNRYQETTSHGGEIGLMIAEPGQTGDGLILSDARGLTTSVPVDFVGRTPPSWQARRASAIVRKLIRQPLGRVTGLGNASVRSVRSLFGATLLFQWLRTDGLRIEPVREGVVRGEWVVPENPRPGALLYVHGGAYVACSPVTHRPITAALARLTGLPVFSLRYRRAPEHLYPAALIDTIAAYGWLLRRLKEQKLDERSLVLAGDSAGGGLVLGALLCLRDAGQTRTAACAVCFSPLTDMTGGGENAQRSDERCAMFRRENITLCARAYLGNMPASEAKYASPALIEKLGGLPPILMQVSSTELLRHDAFRVHEKIVKAGGESKLEDYGDVPHCWQLLDGFVPEARDALKRATAFIRGHTLL